MNEIMKVDPKEFGLEATKVKSIEEAFKPKIAEREGLEIIYKQLITRELTPELCDSARELRLKLVKVRTGIAAIHKAEKAFYHAAGKYVDAWKNKETLPVTQMEEKLQEVEKYFENLEKERIKQLQLDRIEKISLYVEDTEHLDLGNMQDDVFDAYFATKKQQYEERIAAEKKAEEERIAAEKAEQERLEAQRLENIRLQKLAAEKEKQLEKERAEAAAKLEAERKSAQKEAEKLAKAQQIEREKQAEILRVEREKQAKLEAELQAKKDAEIKAEKERLAKIEADKKEAENLAKAPVKDKMNNWVDSMTIRGIGADGFTPEQLVIANNIFAKFEAFKNWAKSEIEKI